MDGITEAAEDPSPSEGEESNEKYYLLPHNSKKSSSYWKYFAEFNPRKHKGFEDKAACKLCFEEKKYKIGTIGRSGGSTSGLKRHLQSHHKKIYEELIGSKKATQMSSKMLVPYLERKKSPRILGVEDMRRHFKLAATSWAISECASFNQFTKPTFRNMFRPFHKNASLITNLDRRSIRDEVERLGRLAEKATQMEMNGRSGLSWTTDHWTSPNDETYTTVTAHYVDDNWKLQSAVLDFKVFSGRTTGERVYDDIISVLKKFSTSTSMVLDTIGITDTTGNMGKMGEYCRQNGRRHAYCTDHNFNRNAQLAFDRKFILHINIFDIHHIMFTYTFHYQRKMSRRLQQP